MHKEDTFFGKPIYVYTRAQALKDGELVDVSQTASEAGFRLPVAVTRAVWEKYIDWSSADNSRQTVQHTSGRLWDVLWMLHLACKRSTEESTLNYCLNVIPRDGRSKKARQIILKSIIAGGDNGEPVITIMLPDED